MKVRIRLFAQQRQLTGWRERTIDLPEGSRVSSAWDALVSEWPILAPGTDSVRFARNAVYADADEPLADGDEVAVIPPVAGGAGSGAARGSGSARGSGTASAAAPNLPNVRQRDFSRYQLGKLRQCGHSESIDVVVYGYFEADDRRFELASRTRGRRSVAKVP